MSEETNASESSAAPTNAELDSAAENVDESTESEEVVTTEVTKEEVVEEKKEEVDNAERSRLGRKVATLESKLDELVNLIKSETRRAPEAVEEVDEDGFLTRKELYAEISRIKKDEETKANKYNSDYINAITDFSMEEDEDTFNEIVAEIDKTANKKFIGNAEIDAQKHYLSAAKVVLNRKLKENSTKKNPLKGGTGAVEFGGASVSKGKEVTMPDLDDSAKDLLKYINRSAKPMSEDDVKLAFASKK